MRSQSQPQLKWLGMHTLPTGGQGASLGGAGLPLLSPPKSAPPDPPLPRVVKELSTTEECKVVKKLLPPKAPGPGGRISVPPQSNRAKAQKQE